MERTPVWKQITLSAVLIAAAAGAWQYRAELGGYLGLNGTGTAQGSAGEQAPGVPVLVAEVTQARDDLTFAGVGTGHALRSVTLRAPASGEITEFNVTPGRRFGEGEVLLRLEDEDERLAVALAEARLERAQSERDRYRRLQDTGAAATARLEEAETGYKVARIELDRARAELADRVLRAPFAGVAGLAEVELGDRIAGDDVIAGFDDRSEILVEFDLPEALLARVAPGQALSARTPATGPREFDGRVVAVNSRVDAASRTARVRAAIANEADLLRPGASFTVVMDLPGAGFPEVPELALQFARSSLYVWRVRNGTAEQVELRMVRRRDGTVLVDGGLEPGDRIVVEGTQRLRPGRRVNVLNDAQAGSSS